MSIWGKVIGGVTGFALGGPLGALVGAMAGHALDKSRAERAGPSRTADKQVVFTLAVIVLSAKMAKADGKVTRDEVDAFKHIFNIPAHEMAGIGEIFNEARKDSKGFEPYAEQIGALFAHDRAVLEELLGGLFHIAMADGVMHPNELEFLQNVAAIFGFSGRDFERIRTGFMGGGENDAYEILGLKRDASDAEVKKTYRKLILENHPDKLMAQGLPQEFIDLANEKMSAINAAYDTIKKQRKFN